MYDSDIPLKFLQIDLDFKLLWTVEITIHYLLLTENCIASKLSILHLLACVTVISHLKNTIQ